MDSSGELFTIGQLARHSGVPARTIRFWTDAGLVPEAARSAGGYRLYDAEAVARRARLLAHLETFTDARVERYWQLQAIINGHQPPPPIVPSYEWVIAALRAHTENSHAEK